ncbi:3-phosphoglycerate dehydrogenase [Kiloniella spongiae]|uniref:D-3-phosphoglycerate dehydrogenase n=1 Tax=Kiloniella spongiae TaxID=1489064 RepID=A0A0H2MHP3_9PROT|nr:phosphoglycerate dehydrogenase [Kiloniella spongiae]KLN62094.1 3-phosphoglycerate dehydrogenase [Kiloniella spongiae]
MVKVLISDKLSPKAADIFRDRGVKVDTKVGLSEEELIAIIGDYDGLAIRSATKVTPQVLEAATKLKVVGRAGIGVDNVNIDAASGKGVVVMNTPHGNSITTAEHAIAMMFATARQIPEANESTQAGKWEKSRFMGSELTAKTLGVIGCGNIGSIVVDRAQGLKMKVISFDPFLSPERAKDLGVEKVELDELLARADFITLHVPLTDQTKGIIDAKALAKTKKGVRIINCARGGLVVEADLKFALESGHVAGAASDVFEVEPAKDSVLFGAPNFVATPHLGASTAEAQENVALQVAEQLSDYLLTGAVTNALNMPSLTAEEFNKLEPYMALSQQLGSFAGQLTRTGLKAIKIDYEGSVASLNCRPLTQTIVASLLAPIMDSVNVVSAPVIARERNIDVSEAKHERDCDFQTLIRLTVTTEKGERSVAGTLFGGKRPRLVNIKGIEIEAELGKHMLYLTNEDSPGYIGALGMQLGEAGVNIATFHLGRTAPGQDAIALIELDSPLDAIQLDKVKQLPQTKQVVQLDF